MEVICKASVEAALFVMAYQAVKQAVSNDKTRPSLMFVHGVVTEKSLLLTGTDGYALTEYTMPAMNTVPGEFFLNPFVFMKFYKCDNIDILCNEEGVMLSTRIASYTHKIPFSNKAYPSTAEIFPKSREETIIHFNQRRMISVLKKCDDIAKIRVPTDPAKPICIESEHGDLKVRSLVLPVLIYGK